MPNNAQSKHLSAQETAKIWIFLLRCVPGDREDSNPSTGSGKVSGRARMTTTREKHFDTACSRQYAVERLC